jgi:hypothetical protein
MAPAVLSPHSVITLTHVWRGCSSCDLRSLAHQAPKVLLIQQARGHVVMTKQPFANMVERVRAFIGEEQVKTNKQTNILCGCPTLS